jgi:putative peptide zinc metalloprotease protein
MILTGFFITSLHGDLLLLQFWNLVSVYGLVMAVTTMHEFAHGLTCSYFGGKVSRIGFMLIYFSPALYCDVSDAWMFPSKRQRVWVTFGGGYFQLVIWGVATVIWRVPADETVISSLALCAVVFGGAQTLFNFNPLIKLDGYYMLSDYLEIPNLRAKAFKAMRAWLGGDPEPLLETPDRRALLAYAAFAMTFSTLLLGVVYVNIYWLVTDAYAFAGLVVFTVFSGFTLRGTTAELAAGVKALVKRASLKKYLSLDIVAVLLLATVVIPWELRIAAEFEILPNEEPIVRTETFGTIAEIPVREGDVVEKGDLIARLFDFITAESKMTVASGSTNPCMSSPVVDTTLKGGGTGRSPAGEHEASTNMARHEMHLAANTAALIHLDVYRPVPSTTYASWQATQVS